jgi:protein gp37
MSDKSKIEWTDATWNPVRGRSKVSPGCKHCYAETFSERFRGVTNHPFEQGFDLRLVPEKLDEPLRWRKPRHVFVNSMSDLFHEDVPDEYILRVAEVMMQANHHTYQVLTKRSERMRDLLNSKLSFAAPAGHIWWGVSAEDRKYGVPRIVHLQAANAAVRFLSVESSLEDIGELDLRGIHWVIVGGEGGMSARTFDIDWARSVLRQCREQKAPCFVKQLGRRPVMGATALKLNSAKGGDWAEWPADLRVREYPTTAVPGPNPADADPVEPSFEADDDDLVVLP